MNNFGDIYKEYVRSLSNRSRLYHVINRAGVPYSIIEIDGREMLSCERERENNMVKHFYKRRHIYEG